MPPKKSYSAKLDDWTKDFTEEEKRIFRIDGKAIFCNACVKSFGFKQSSELIQHVNTQVHQRAVKISKGSHQLLMTDTPPRANEFSQDLCEALVAADIPWNKLENPKFKEFLEKYCKRTIPSESTLRRTVLKQNYDKVIENIRQDLANQYIWLGIDETTDSCGRFVANVIVGALTGEPSKPRLLMSRELPCTNNTTITDLIQDSLHFLWPGKSEADIKKQFLILLTDAAAYMIKAGQNLKPTHPNLIHLTCLAHALHRVAEIIRANFEEVNRVISSVKAVFKKAKSRVRAYQEMYPGLALPPEPILIRWGTWLEAVDFYAENYEKVKNVVNSFDPSDAECIRQAQFYFEGPFIPAQLADLSANFTFIATAIKKLEERNLPMSEAIDIIADAYTRLQKNKTHNGQKTFEKLQSVLKKNPGYEAVSKISSILSGKVVETNMYGGISVHK